MFKKIEELIYQKHLTKKEVAQKMGMKYNTFLLKLKGEYPFTFDEALLLKKVLETDLPIETLFEKSAA